MAELYSINAATWKSAVRKWYDDALDTRVGLIFNPSYISEQEIQEFAFNALRIVVDITNYAGYLKRIGFKQKLTDLPL